MKPLFIRALGADERESLARALHSASSFTLRRAQIILASDRGQSATVIAEQCGCSRQEVRNVLHAFEHRGVAALQPCSRRSHSPAHVWDPANDERLRALLHQSPRVFGHARSPWHLALLAEVAYQQGLTPKRVSIETIRRVLLRLGISWRRARDWITSPDPQYATKKNAATG